MEFPRDSDEQRKVTYEAHLRTNELLEQLIQLQTNKTVVEPIKTPENRTNNKTQQRGKAK